LTIVDLVSINIQAADNYAFTYHEEELGAVGKQPKTQLLPQGSAQKCERLAVLGTPATSLRLEVLWKNKMFMSVKKNGQNENNSGTVK
jgi:hypothetical protein